MGIFGSDSKNSAYDDFAGSDDMPVFNVDGIDPEKGVELLDNAKRIDLDRIEVEENTRKIFDEEKLRELAASLNENGLINPINVRKDGDIYVITAGERRYRAAKIAGWQSIPCIIADGDIFAQIAENIQRENLQPLEEANAYKKAMEQHGLNGKQLAEKLGISAARVSRSVRLLDLSPRILELVEAGKVSKSALREIFKVKDEQRQWELVQQYLETGGSVGAVKVATGTKDTRKTKRGTTKKGTIGEIKFTASSRKRLTNREIAEAVQQWADELKAQLRDRTAA